MKNRQTGFTLVEIAIVLVIIGLLLGGVLKGQELIYSAKSKAVINDIRNTMTMITAYQDRFRALPGDDKNAAAHLAIGSGASSSSASSIAGGNGDGKIDDAWNETGAAKESALVWQHLRAANLASGSTDAPSLGTWEPLGAEGGRIGVQSTRPAGFTTGRLFVCEGNITGRVASQLDATMDDGNPGGGSVRAYDNTTSIDNLSSAAQVAAYDDTKVYIICGGF